MQCVDLYRHLGIPWMADVVVTGEVESIEVVRAS